MTSNSCTTEHTLLQSILYHIPHYFDEKGSTFIGNVNITYKITLKLVTIKHQSALFNNQQVIVLFTKKMNQNNC